MKVIQTLRSLDRETQKALALVLTICYIISGFAAYDYGYLVEQETDPSLWLLSTKVEAFAFFFITTFLADVMSYYTIKDTIPKD